MASLDIYLKVQIELSEGDQPGRLGDEICRQIRRVYGVRLAEVTSVVSPEELSEP